MKKNTHSNCSNYDQNNYDESNYSKAGVNIDAGNQLVTQIKPLIKQTQRKESLSQLGGFAALTNIPSGYKQPILATTTDGVGTKVRLAIEQKQLTGIGIDLVAMCVNDLICTGAEPLTFLDYYATAALNIEQAQEVITSIAEGCKLAGCELAGGETAEMPGMYHPNDFDLAGFCLGIAEKERLLDPQKITDQDALIALPASGPHANGYALIRWLLHQHQIDLQEQLEGKTLAEHLLQPTCIYVAEVLAVLRQFTVKGMAHITGGGITENLPRCLPDYLHSVIDLNSWRMPAVFQWLQRLGDITPQEMLRTFNCGVGMILVVDGTQKEEILHFLHQYQNVPMKAWETGFLRPQTKAQSSRVTFTGTLV